MTLHTLNVATPHRGYDVYEADGKSIAYFPDARKAEIVDDHLHITDAEGEVLAIYPIHSWTCCLRTPPDEAEGRDDDATATADGS